MTFKQDPTSMATRQEIPCGYLLKQSESDPSKFYKRWFSAERKSGLMFSSGRWILRCTQRPTQSSAELDFSADIEAYERAEAHRAARRKWAAQSSQQIAGKMCQGRFELGALVCSSRSPWTTYRVWGLNFSRALPTGRPGIG